MLQDDLDQHGRYAVAVVLKERLAAPKGSGSGMPLMLDQIEIRCLRGPIPPGSAFQNEPRQVVFRVSLHIVVKDFISKPFGNFLKAIEIVLEGPIFAGVGKGVFAFPCVNQFMDDQPRNPRSVDHDCSPLVQGYP